MNRTVFGCIGTLAMLGFSCVVGCGSPPPTEDGGITDAAQIVRCTRDEECDDLMFCNGVEQCLPAATGADARGCLARTMPRCADAQICDEVSDQCITDCGADADADGDGHDATRCGGDDCDDSDAHRFPGAPEVCDASAHDEDCDETTFGTRDVDGDRIIDAVCCNVRADGTRLCGADCNDSNIAINPAASETCDGLDDDCDGSIDEGALVAGFRDRDGDLHGDPTMSTMACPGSALFSTIGDDCNDDPSSMLALAQHGAQVEICDGVDNDCDGTTDESPRAVPWYADRDHDGFGSALSGVQVSCAPLSGYSLLATDCDDALVTVSPVAAELCNGLDDNCNGRADFLVAANDTEDDDLDGVADMRCPVVPVDCNDRDPLTYPGAPELCDGRDNDCNGSADTATTMSLWYVDADHDRFGDPAIEPVSSCEPQTGRVTNGGDCDDTRASVAPGARDGCAGLPSVDDDCDMRVDEDQGDVAFFVDGDGDGYGSGAPVLACGLVPGRVATAGDCDDLDPTRNPDAPETCDGTSTRDWDCDGAVGCDDTDCASASACVLQYRLVVVSGGGQTPQVTRAAAMPVVFELDDAASGMPVPAIRVTLSADRGGSVTVTGATYDAVTGDPSIATDASGRITATVRGGLRPGAFDVVARAAHASPATASFSSVPVPNGWAIPAIGVARTGVPCSGPCATVGSGVQNPHGIAIASDGTFYFADFYSHSVYRVDPTGVQTRLAGSGVSGESGDGGPATMAAMSYPLGLALDERARLLYIAESARIRVVDLTTSRIYTYGGGGGAPAPGYGDEGPATSAQFPSPIHLGLGPDGSLYVDGTDRIRRIDAAGVVHAVLAPTGACTGALTLQSCSGYGCSFAFDAEGTMFVAGSFCGGALGGAIQSAIVRVAADRSLALVAGSGTGGTSDGAAATATRLSGVSAIAFDPGGHLYYADATANLVRRIDTATGRVTTVLGTGVAGRAGDYADATLAQTNQPWDLTFDVGGTLWVSELGNSAIRFVPGTSRAATHATLVAASGQHQSVWIGQTVPTPMGASVQDDTGAPVRAIDVDFEIAPDGIAPAATVISATRAASGLSGIASVGGQVGLAIGTYRYLARFRDIHGHDVTGSPLAFDVVAAAPPTGTIFPVTGAPRASGALTPGSAIVSRNQGVSSVAVGPDGSVYFGDYYGHQVARIDPTGVLSIVGGTGANGSGADDVPATTSAIAYPGSIALSGTQLYVADSAGHRVRAIDLTTGLIHRYAGTGATGAYVEGADAATTPLQAPSAVAIAPDGAVWVEVSPASGPAIVRIDPATRAITTMVATSPSGACTSGTVIRALNTAGFAGTMAFASDGTLFFGGNGCSLTVTYPSAVIFRRSPAGAIDIYAGTNLAGGGEGGAATSTIIDGLGSLAVGPAGVYYTQVTTPRLRLIDAVSRTVRTIAGDGIAHSTGDGGPASASGIGTPRDVAVTSDGHVFVAEYGAYVLREIW